MYVHMYVCGYDHYSYKQTLLNSRDSNMGRKSPTHKEVYLVEKIEHLIELNANFNTLLKSGRFLYMRLVNPTYLHYYKI